MLATFVLDAYKNNERQEMADELDFLLTDNCWSTAGIYCYWNYTTHEPLYIGLATDLHQRFMQHNGLLYARANTCKKIQIDEYFQANEKLGFSIALQSALSQPVTRKYRDKYKEFWETQEAQDQFYFGRDAEMNIRILEGISIQTTKDTTGSLPAWNKIGGYKQAGTRVTPEHAKLLRLLTHQEVNDNVSRATLRELNKGYNFYECFLHSLRIAPVPPAEMIKTNREIGNGFIIDDMEATGYLKRKLVI